ncbi:MAG: hypothetical protein RJB01_411 [Actinomycetota bacterium]
MAGVNEYAERRAQIEFGLHEVQNRIDHALRAANRTDGVTLVVVTKTFPASDVEILAELGVKHVGENRDQEASRKRADVGDLGLTWHMIGQVQRNKANSIARWADVVETVDREQLVDALARAAGSRETPLDVLLQVSLDEPPVSERGGARPEDLMFLAERVSGYPQLQLAGVMAVAPHPGDPELAFARLRASSAELTARWPMARSISAGMSGDLEEAIAQGATQVRIGGAILGARPPVE